MDKDEVHNEVDYSHISLGEVWDKAPSKLKIITRIIIIVLIFILALLWGEVIVSLSVWITEDNKTDGSSIPSSELELIEEEGGEILAEEATSTTFFSLLIFTAALTALVALLIIIIPLSYLPSSLL